MQMLEQVQRTEAPINRLETAGMANIPDFSPIQAQPTSEMNSDAHHQPRLVAKATLQKSMLSNDRQSWHQQQQPVLESDIRDSMNIGSSLANNKGQAFENRTETVKFAEDRHTSEFLGLNQRPINS